MINLVAPVDIQLVKMQRVVRWKVNHMGVWHRDSLAADAAVVVFDLATTSLDGSMQSTGGVETKLRFGCTSDLADVFRTAVT